MTAAPPARVDPARHPPAAGAGAGAGSIPVSGPGSDMRRGPAGGPGTLTFALVFVLAAGGACVAPKGEPAGRPLPGLAGAWAPRPVTLRIYPATRFVRGSGGPQLDARVELFDAMGDPVKGSGRVRLELREPGPAAAARGRAGDEPGLLYRWDVELATLSDHETYYDPVTATYAFPLRLEDFRPAAGGAVLRVTWGLASGDRLQDEQPVRTSLSDF